MDFINKVADVFSSVGTRAKAEIENVNAAKAEAEFLAAEQQRLAADIKDWESYRNGALIILGITSVYGLTKILREPR